jgi:hypothetical protein
VTESQARTAANVVMAAAALGAAVIVLRSPRLRRLAFQLARQYAGAPLTAWAATSVRDAWDASARAETAGALRRSKDMSVSAGALPARPPSRPAS